MIDAGSGSNPRFIATAADALTMRSDELDLEQYDTDKIRNGYLDHYDSVFEPWVHKEITLLEVGVHRGGSLMLWRDYFPRGTIVGIDLKDPPADYQRGERIHIYRGCQTDAEFLTRVANEMAPEGFDIIIDDASHLGHLTKITFWHLFDNHLKPRGTYAIEDWPSGYWGDWPDGRCLDLERILALPSPPPDRGNRGFWSRVIRRIRGARPLACHSYGMVGFVKQLVDEQAAADVLRVTPLNPPGRPSKFRNMQIVPGIVFVRKADPPEQTEVRPTPSSSHAAP